MNYLNFSFISSINVVSMRFATVLFSFSAIACKGLITFSSSSLMGYTFFGILGMLYSFNDYCFARWVIDRHLLPYRHFFNRNNFSHLKTVRILFDKFKASVNIPLYKIKVFFIHCCFVGFINNIYYMLKYFFVVNQSRKTCKGIYRTPQKMRLFRKAQHQLKVSQVLCLMLLAYLTAISFYSYCLLHKGCYRLCAEKVVNLIPLQLDQYKITGCLSGLLNHKLLSRYLLAFASLSTFLIIRVSINAFKERLALAAKTFKSIINSSGMSINFLIVYKIYKVYTNIPIVIE